jgi:hypothetical protein
MSDPEPANRRELRELGRTGHPVGGERRGEPSRQALILKKPLTDGASHPRRARARKRFAARLQAAVVLASLRALDCSVQLAKAWKQRG